MSTASPALPTLSATTGSIAQTSAASVTNTASASTASQSASQSASSSAQSSGSGSSASGSSASSSVSASVITGAPALTSASASHLSDLPTLSGFYSYPAPTVPPTSNAPYMQSLNVPQNFVFIVVGAVVAFFAICLIAWRFIAAWSINRNIKRDGGSTAYMPLYADTKKKPAKTEQSHDMADLSQLPKAFGASAPSLFFSPTAEVAKQNIGQRPASQLYHQHMPSGHYRDGST